MTTPALPIAGRALINAGSQMAGRVALSGLRFLVMLIVVKRAGVARFGEFALILSLVLFAEVLADFGMNDVAVREAGQKIRTRQELLGGLLVAKGLLALAGGLVIVTSLQLLRYPREVILGALGVLPAIFAYAGVLLFRLGLKSELRMEKEVTAETISVLSTLPLYYFVARSGVPLWHLTACHSLSRLIFLTVLLITARRHVAHPAVEHAWSEARHLAKIAYPIGIALLVACSYDSIDLIFLSKLRSARDAGLYSGAMRFVQLAIMLIYPVADTAFPVLVARWHSRAEFRETLRTVFRLTSFMAGGAFCALFAGAGGLLRAVSHEMLDARLVLQVLAFVAFGRALMTMMQPLLIVSHGIRHALWLVAVSIALKIALLSLVISRWGPIGAAGTNAVGEVVSILLVSMIVQRLIGFRLHWAALPRVALAAALALGTVRLIGWWGGWLGLISACLFYCAFGLVVRAVPTEQLGPLLQQARARLSKPTAPVIT